MPFNVSEFKARGIPLGGARSNQFSVDIFTPFGSGVESSIRFACRAATIPPAIINPIRVYYFGRPVKVNGDREIPDWTVTVINDDDQSRRVLFERWQNQINTFISNRMSDEMYPMNYKSSAIVTQYNKVGGIARQWELRGLWPSEVAPIPLDWDAQNQIQSFDVTFSYDEWAPYAAESSGLADEYNPVLESDGIET